MSDPLLPDQCHTMTDVRAGVDATDKLLVSLLSQRFAYMRAAARIKADRTLVRDEDRKAAVIAAVQAEAARFGLPDEALAAMWEQLVEASIAYELAEWDRIKG